MLINVGFDNFSMEIFTAKIKHKIFYYLKQTEKLWNLPQRFYAITEGIFFFCNEYILKSSTIQN